MLFTAPVGLGSKVVTTAVGISLFGVPVTDGSGALEDAEVLLETGADVGRLELEPLVALEEETTGDALGKGWSEGLKPGPSDAEILEAGADDETLETSADVEMLETAAELETLEAPSDVEELAMMVGFNSLVELGLDGRMTIPELKNEVTPGSELAVTDSVADTSEVVKMDEDGPGEEISVGTAGVSVAASGAVIDSVMAERKLSVGGWLRVPPVDDGEVDPSRTTDSTPELDA